jgi:hypothetical protein
LTGQYEISVTVGDNIAEQNFRRRERRVSRFRGRAKTEDKDSVRHQLKLYRRQLWGTLCPYSVQVYTKRMETAVAAETSASAKLSYRQGFS